MKYYLLRFSLLLFSIFMLVSGRATAACSDPAGIAGDIVYNSTSSIMQYCDGASWLSFPKGGGDPCSGTPASGARCADGTVYVGLSPDGNQPMFTTYCDAGMSWNGTTCTGSRTNFAWGSSGTARGTTSNTDGDGNTATLASFGAAAHPAADHCASLLEAAHSDWYLPARSEFALFPANFTFIPGLSMGGQNITSSEISATNAWVYNFMMGDFRSLGKHVGLFVRCVRQGYYATVCENPPGNAGDLAFNSSFRVLQFCDGSTWHAAGPVGPTGPNAGCSSPDGVAGDVLYNPSYSVLQYCDGDVWRSVGK